MDLCINYLSLHSVKIEEDSKEENKEICSICKEDSEEENKEICSICKERSTGEIIMTCAGMHSYCFECILNWIETKEIISCPDCRKKCSSIIIPKNNNNKVKHFLDSVQLLPNINSHHHECTCYNDEFENTCVFPDWILESYINNQEQIDFFNENKDKYPIAKLKKMIHWS